MSLALFSFWVFWCSPAAALPLAPLPLAFGGADQWFRGLSLVCLRLDIWLFRQRSGRLAGLHDLLSATVWSGDGDLPFPSSSYCMASKASALCGAPPSTPCCVWRLWFLASPSESASLAPRHHSLRRSAACVPSSAHSAKLPVCPPLPVLGASPCRICFLFVSSSGASSVFVCFLAQRDGLKASLEASRLGNFSKPKKIKG